MEPVEAMHRARSAAPPAAPCAAAPSAASPRTPSSGRERSLDAFDARLPWPELVAAVRSAAPRGADGPADVETLLRHALLGRFFGLDAAAVLERTRAGGPMRRFALRRALASGTPGEISSETPGATPSGDATPPSRARLERFGRGLVDADVARALLAVADALLAEEGAGPQRRASARHSCSLAGAFSSPR